MQRKRSTTQRIISPVAITELELLAPVCTPAGEAASLTQREVVFVTQARAQAIVRSVNLLILKSAPGS